MVEASLAAGEDFVREESTGSRAERAATVAMGIVEPSLGRPGGDFVCDRALPGIGKRTTSPPWNLVLGPSPHPRRRTAPR